MQSPELYSSLTTIFTIPRRAT